MQASRPHQALRSLCMFDINLTSAVAKLLGQLIPKMSFLEELMVFWRKMSRLHCVYLCETASGQKLNSIKEQIKQTRPYVYICLARETGESSTNDWGAWLAWVALSAKRTVCVVTSLLAIMSSGCSCLPRTLRIEMKEDLYQFRNIISCSWLDNLGFNRF